MSRQLILLLFMISLLLLAACESTTSPPTSIAIVAPTDTAVITPTIEIVNTPTTVPETETAVPPTSEPTTTPTVTPAETATTASADTAVPVDTSTPVPEPSPTTPTVSNAIIEVEGASVPAGFSFKKFTTMYRPTGLAFDENGRLYATSFDGSVRIFTDDDGDGHADTETNFAGRFNTPLGVAIRPGTNDVYVSSMGTVTLLRDTTGNDRADTRVDLITGLPFGLHQNDNLKFGPDGMLYMGIGSTCDVCVENNPRSATIMRFNPETGVGDVYATGMRNPYDLAFHPLTGELFATDNGRDDLGDDAPGEELNHIIQGADYGWPDCWDDFQGLGCNNTTKAIALFEAHASVNSIDFYTGDQFPATYKFSPFVAAFGSFIKQVQTGIAWVSLTPDGDTYSGEIIWFATWPGAMPLGLVEGPDGALYVGDYINDAIYRISYDP